MTSKRVIVLWVVILLATLLAACELAASTPPPTVSQAEQAMSTLKSELGTIATQTAIAGGVTTLPTPIEPSEATSLPISTATPGGQVQPTSVPPTATFLPVASATPGLPRNYRLQRGEHPFCIARRFNVDQYELLNINGLNINSKPEVGFVLQIPRTGNPFIGERALKAHPTTYTVKAGDTIYSIACLFGDVDPNAIAQANGLKEPYSLNAGQTINIP